jgi:hypothetical protein
MLLQVKEGPNVFVNKWQDSSLTTVVYECDCSSERILRNRHDTLLDIFIRGNQCDKTSWTLVTLRQGKGTVPYLHAPATRIRRVGSSVGALWNY